MWNMCANWYCSEFDMCKSAVSATVFTNFCEIFHRFKAKITALWLHDDLMRNKIYITWIIILFDNFGYTLSRLYTIYFIVFGNDSIQTQQAELIAIFELFSEILFLNIVCMQLSMEFQIENIRHAFMVNQTRIQTRIMFIFVVIALNQSDWCKWNSLGVECMVWRWMSVPVKINKFTK